MSWIMVEYHCGICGHTFESLEKRPPEVSYKCPNEDCEARAFRCISPVKGKTVWAWAERGSIDEPPPGAFSTRDKAK